MAPSTVLPQTFARAIEKMHAVRPRPEIVLEEVAAPQRLAPYAHALGAGVRREPDGSDLEVATGRLILLHDPAGHEAWQGGTRLVTYVTADLEADLAADPLLPGVGWSWLVDALEAHGADYCALGGTVTQTLSTRFGNLSGSPMAADVEIRASWSPRGDDLGAHVEAWCGLLAAAAGLPPPGVTALPDRRRPGASSSI